ncbi:NfeD family protein [Candidatus Sumerlaeota bacterium]|nr:NfeD family protein [Candidatus Sumerlaeota bacterium]
MGSVFSFIFDWSGLDTFYLFCAVAGGIVFLLRCLLMLFGLGDADVDVPGLDSGGGDVIGDSDVGFRLLSIQGLTSFFIMFGLVGLALSRETEVAPSMAAFGAFAAGTGTLFVMAWITLLMLKMQSSGTMDMKKAIGEEGTVYLDIPGTGTGKARVAIQERIKVLDAVSADKKAIKTGARVKVVDVVGGSTVVVEKI